jgi:glutathione S-transferase
MYRLHIANKNYSSWSLRPWACLSELGIPFEEVQHYFGGGYGQNTEFLAFSPTAMVPCLEDGDLRIWESLAIIEHVADEHPEVWPADKAAKAFARSAAAEMHAGFSVLRNICSMNCGLRIKLKETPDRLKRDVARLDALFNEGLSRFGGPFLAGSKFTAVDAFFAPIAFRAQTYDLWFGEAAAAYLKRLLALPSVKAWYEAALIETAREEEHEAEFTAAGQIIADYRIAEAAHGA